MKKELPTSKTSIPVLFRYMLLLTVMLVFSAKAQSQAVTRVITDFGGFWLSDANSTLPQPDDRHNMLAFRYNGVTYSTGVNDATLTANSATVGTYSAQSFRAYPLGSIAGNVGASTYMALAQKVDGISNAGNVAGISNLTTPVVLNDGLRGLDIGTGVTNLPVTAIITFPVTVSATADFTDAIPEFVVAAIADPAGSTDKYSFVDSAGNTVGTVVSSILSGITQIGTYKVDLFTFTGNPLATATPNAPFTSGAGTRSITMAAFKFSDFGITSSNYANIVGFKIIPSGDTDPAFYAFNTQTVLSASPEITTQPVSQVVCPNGSSSATFTVVATGTGLSYQWRKNGVNISGATSSSYTINPVTASDAATYTVVVSNSSGSITSQNAVLNTYFATQPTASTTTCQGSNVGLSVYAPGSGVTYQWYSNTTNSNTGGTSISGATSINYTASAAAAGTFYYYAVATASGCSTSSSVAKIIVDPTSVAGTISGSTTICSGSTATLTLTGYTGSIQWTSSSTSTGTYTNISGATGSSYTTPALSATTYYKAKVTNGSCTAATTSGFGTITVNTPSNAGTVTANQSVCSGASVVLSTTGSNGTLQWQQSADGTTGWANVSGGSGGSTASYTTPALTATTYYRVVATNSPCTLATSSTVSVTVSPVSNSGTVSANTTICSNTTTVVSTTGSVGVLQWQQSADGTTGWVNVSGGSGGNTASYTTPALTATTYYRVVASSSPCTYATSATITVTVSPVSNAGTVSANQSVCTGTAAVVSTTGSTGTLQWQQSADGTTGWANVTGGSGSNTASYTTPALTATTYYRVVATNSPCSLATSSTITVTVSPLSNAGTVSSDQTICSGSTTVLTTTGSVGTPQWQQSADGTTGWVNVTGGSGGNTASYTTAALTATTYYRVVTTSSPCTYATSSTIAITVNPAPSFGTVSGSQTVCSSSTAVLSTTGASGVLQWQQSADGTTGWTNVVGGSGGNTSSYTTAALTTTTYYRLVASGGAPCPYAVSPTITITVTTASNAGTASANQTVCYNSSVVVSVTGTSGSLQWQQSADGITGWADVTGGSGATTDTYTTPNLTATTYYRAVATNGTCTVYSSAVMITVATNINTWEGDVSNDWNVAANWSCNVVPSATIDANIPVVATVYPLLSGATGTCLNLNIATGASLTVGTAGVIQIAGAINSTGTIDVTQGAADFIGTSAQVIPANVFSTNYIRNLRDHNATTVTLQGPLNVTGVLGLKNGTFNTGDFLTLKSNASTTAMISEVTGAVSGTMTIERYIPARRAFRFLTSPVDAGTIFENWQENGADVTGIGTDITGAGGTANGFDVSGSNNPSMFTYLNNNPGSGSNWNAVTNTNSTNLLAGVPYRILIRGDRTVDQTSNSAPATVTTLRATGTIKTGDITVTDLNPDAQGFSLIGNPYQAPVDMKQILFESSQSADLVPFYTIWDPTVNARGAYVAVDLETGDNTITNPLDETQSSVADKYLQPGQACFVQTVNSAGANPSLMFKEVNKHVSTVTTNVFRTMDGTDTEIAKMRLSLYDNAALDVSGPMSDGLVVYFADSYSNDFDNQDAKKVVNQDESIGTVVDGNILSFQKRSLPTVTDVIQLSHQQYRKQHYTYKAQVTGLSGVTAYLYDAYNNTYSEMTNDGTSSLPFDVDADIPASIAVDRFQVVFQTNALGTGDHGFASTVSVYPNPVTEGQFYVRVPSESDNYKVTLVSILGQEIGSTVRNSGNNTILVHPDRELAAGVYMVQITNGTSTATKKIIVK